MINLNFKQLDKESMCALYSIDFDSGTLLKTLLNDIQDIQELEQIRKLYSVGTVQIYKAKELYDEPIVEVKYIGGIISDNEWKKIPIHILNKLVKYAYMFNTIMKNVKEKQEENRFGVFSKIYKSIKKRFK